MKRIFLLILLSFLWGWLFLSVALAQTVSLIPSASEVEQDTNFSLTLNVASVTNLFGIAFDLSFNPSLISFVSVNEEDFLTPGCQTSLMSSENPSGNLIIGYSRQTNECGGVSGSGDLMTLNFKSLNQAGTNNFSFSYNKLCLLDGSSCNYIDGTWQTASVTINAVQPSDTTPPSVPTSLIAVGTSPYKVQLNWGASTDNTAVIGYKIYRDGDQVGTSPTNSYQDDNLWPSTTYSYRIAAYDAADNTSAQTNAASATTQDLPPEPNPGPGSGPSTPPSTPDSDPDPDPIPTPDPTPMPDPDPEESSFQSNPAVDFLVKSPNSDKLYLIANNKKRWIVNAEVFHSYGLEANSQKTISQTELDQYPSGEDLTQPSLPRGNLIRAKDDFKVYIIEPPFKRHIFNPVIFNMYGHLRWEDIIEVDSEIVSSYITSDLYRSYDDFRVYSLEEVDEIQGVAIKHHIDMSAQQFEDKGYSWQQIFIVNPEERDYYQTGENLVN